MNSYQIASYYTAPKSTKQFNHINIKYALKNCNVFKYKWKLQALLIKLRSSIVNKLSTTVAQLQLAKGMHMHIRYHWLRDQINLGNFTIKWKPRVINQADIFTNSHPVNHHLAMRNVYLNSEEGVLIFPISTV